MSVCGILHWGGESVWHFALGGVPWVKVCSPRPGGGHTCPPTPPPRSTSAFTNTKLNEYSKKIAHREGGVIGRISRRVFASTGHVGFRFLDKRCRLPIPLRSLLNWLHFPAQLMQKRTSHGNVVLNKYSMHWFQCMWYPSPVRVLATVPQTTPNFSSTRASTVSK